MGVNIFGDNFRDVTLVTVRALDPLQGSRDECQRDAAIYSPTLTYLWDSLVLQHERKREEDSQGEEWCLRSLVRRQCGKK